MDETDLSWWYLTPDKRPPNAGGPLPPPYHLLGCEFLMVNLEFEPAAVRSMLPRSLTPTTNFSGGFGIAVVASGFGIAPYSGCFAWIDVEGHDSSDGGKGRFHAGGYLSGLCGEAFRTFFRNSRVDAGDGAIVTAGDRVVAAGGRDEVHALRMTCRLTERTTDGVSGVNYYIHEAADSGLCVNSSAYTLSITLCDDLEMQFSELLNRPFAALNPQRVLLAIYAAGSHTLGEPKKLAVKPGETGDFETRMVVLNVFSQLGRAAVLVGEKGRVFLVNDRARPYLGHGLSVTAGRLRARRAADQAALERILSTALTDRAHRFDAETIAIDGLGGDRRLLAQAVPVPSHFDAPAAALLLTDPTTREPADVASSLQLLGLTPAEARAATVVGAGLSHREAAERIGISEGTVRVTLSQVYGKLGLSRATELAALVSRLSAAAPAHEA